MSVPEPNVGMDWALASAGLNGVQTGPGATALTRIPLLIKLLASALVNA